MNEACGCAQTRGMTSKGNVIAAAVAGGCLAALVVALIGLTRPLGSPQDLGGPVVAGQSARSTSSVQPPPGVPEPSPAVRATSNPARGAASSGSPARPATSPAGPASPATAQAETARAKADREQAARRHAAQQDRRSSTSPKVVPRPAPIPYDDDADEVGDVDDDDDDLRDERDDDLDDD